MTENIGPDEQEQPQYEGGSLVPITPGDWRKRAAELEAQRNSIRSILEARGIDPHKEPAYVLLLGELGGVNQQIIGLDFNQIKDGTDIETA